MLETTDSCRLAPYTFKKEFCSESPPNLPMNPERGERTISRSGARFQCSAIFRASRPPAIAAPDRSSLVTEHEGSSM
ncbi:hypothetical protein NDU88_002421 [Pleurodeles waltl]|uniref:Uncharacterized protein n=1 Tax=Pleurodeles waltl TaxID=8319 RepID=A0AAV7P9Y0_PLEWA|nr:hypothetical protein NDU88_002421 [Pleurodeles waltl]